MKKIKEIGIEDGIRWIQLDGEDNGTGFVFTHETYGITEDNRIVDSEGYPLESESDFEAIAVRNSIK